MAYVFSVSMIALSAPAFAGALAVPLFDGEELMIIVTGRTANEIAASPANGKSWLCDKQDPCGTGSVMVCAQQVTSEGIAIPAGLSLRCEQYQEAQNSHD